MNHNTPAMKKMYKIYSMCFLMSFAMGIQAQITGVPGTALSFDGTNDYVAGSGFSTSVSAITIEAWIYHESLPADEIQRYVTISPEVAVLRYDGSAAGGNDELHFYIRKTDGSLYSLRADNVLTANAWMYIVGTYDGNAMKLYLNGTPVASATIAAGLYPTDGSFSFSKPDEAFSGKMDEVRVWNTARSQQQIRENMHLTLTGTETGLINYWQFNEGSGTTVIDAVGGCTGTLFNMTPESWITSTIPAGSGVSNTQTEIMGNVSFTGTGFSADYSSQNGASVTVSKLNVAPNSNPNIYDDFFDNQYWVVSRFGTGSFMADFTFTVSEGFTSDDEAHPYNIWLYRRGSNSDGGWYFVSGADSVSSLNGTAVFDDVSDTGQFIVCRRNNGSGTSDNPFLITNLDDLEWLSLTDGIWYNDSLYYIQTADIDASDTKNWNDGNGFSPIGNSTTGFHGHYNGMGHNISGLYINRPSTDYVGLFGYISYATVDSLGLKDISITGYFYTGGLSGRASNSNISNCYIMGNVDGYHSTGGLVGAVAGNLTISKSYTMCDIQGGNSVGGLLGRISENSVIMVNNSFCTGNVQASGNGAGLFGEIAGNLTAENCYNSCNVNSTYVYAGGLSGYIGFQSTFSNCYSTGNVTGSSIVGGLFGHIFNSTVSNCYSTGHVEGSTSGGLIGNTNSSETPFTLTGCYWDKESSGKTNAFGVYYGSQTATGLTTAEMKQQASFENWNFDTIWAIRADSTYPALRAVDNAPFDFRDTIRKWNAIPLDTLLVNDYDYETLHNNLVIKVIDSADCTISDGLIYFPESMASLDTRILIYRTGEVRPLIGDTLYGNEVTATLIRGAQEGIEGSGTEADPFQIKNLADLEWLSSKYCRLCMDKYFIQTADIDADSTRYRNISGTDTLGFLPIGNDTLQFSGHYNGSGHTISGLYINRPDSLYIGLFGYTSGATIDSLGLTDCDITGKAYTGSLVGYAKSSAINNCYSTGLVNSPGMIAGSYLQSYSGGLIGYCYYYTSINNSYSSCNIFASGNFIGGLVGYNYSFSTISNSHSLGNLNGTSRIGGLAGKNDDNSTISKCYFAGTVSASTNSEGYLGGLVGMNQTASSVRNCYNTGSVNGSGTNIGGLVGYNGTAIVNSYSAGPVNATGTNIGGLVGNSGLGSVTNSFWDTETSGITTGNYGTGLTTAEMKQQSTFTDADWDFMGETANGTEEIWAMIPQINSGYPILFQQDDVLYTYNVTEIIGTTATLNAKMRLTSTLNVMSYGACWAQTNPPGLDDYKTDLGATSMNGDYSYSATLSGLNIRESYYAVAYIITTENDTLFGNVIPFTTGGNGTANNPYQIETLDDLEWLSLSDTIWNDSLYFIQIADIDASATSTWNSGSGFSPVGNGTTHFTGHYNGKGHTISGLYINRSLTDYIGLFGYASGAAIDSLGMTDCNITGKSYKGCLVGKNVSSLINHCFSTGIINGGFSEYVGGLVGQNYRSMLTNCHSTVSVKNSMNYGGGLVGQNNKSSVISNSYSTGSVKGTTSYTGGLAGDNIDSSKVVNSYSAGNVTGKDYVGGLLGGNYINTTAGNCYSTGNVSGSTYVGGLVGLNFSTDTISNCYSTGSVTGTGVYTGGLVGRNLNVVTGSFWNTLTSGTTTSSGGIASTTAEMKQQATFAGWDFGSTWAIRENNTYPALLAVEDNAPFAFADTLHGATTIGLARVLANDYDYETLQSGLTFELITNTTHFGTVSGGTYTFNSGVSFGDTDTLVYRVGDVIVAGDTLWGNRATAFLAKIRGNAWNGTGTWDQTAYWSKGVVPSTTDTVYVESGSLTLNLDAEVEGLTIDEGAELHIAPGGALTVNGDMENHAGTSGLVLHSDVSATASLLQQSAGVDASVERYIPAYSGNDGWHFLSSSVAAQPIRPGFVNNGTPDPGTDFYKFSEPQYLWISTKDNSGNWNTGFEDNFVVGRGYNVAYPVDVTKTFTGTLNEGDFVLNGSTVPAVTYTESGGSGWNLLGNPFSSAIDWDQCLPTNIDAAVYVFDGDLGQYVSWNGTIGALTGGIIPSMNGFFIKAAPDPALTIPNAARMHADVNFYKSKNDVANLLVLKVEGNGFSDRTFINFNGEASMGFDRNYDAYKLSGIDQAPQLYTKADDTGLSINTLPYSPDEVSVPLCLEAGSERAYKISVSQNTFWQSVDISCRDLKTGTVYDLRNQTSFTVTQGPDDEPDRFLLLFDGATGVNEMPPGHDIEIYSWDHTVMVKSDRHENIQVSVFNLLGQKVAAHTENKSTDGSPTGQIEIDLKDKKGFFVVRAATSTFTKTRKIFIP